jgi:hypothetical protein
MFVIIAYNMFVILDMEFLCSPWVTQAPRRDQAVEDIDAQPARIFASNFSTRDATNQRHAFKDSMLPEEAPPDWEKSIT